MEQFEFETADLKPIQNHESQTTPQLSTKKLKGAPEDCFSAQIFVRR